MDYHQALWLVRSAKGCWIIYLASVINVTEAAGKITETGSPAWKEATRTARLECMKALVEFNAHQREHDCTVEENSK
jgi:hypothetical protein